MPRYIPRATRLARSKARKLKKTGKVAFSKAKGQVTTMLVKAPSLVELKRSYQDATAHDYGTLTDGQRVHKRILPAIVQGDRLYDRDGNHIKIKRITVSMIVTNKQGLSNFFRVALLQEKYLNSIGVASMSDQAMGDAPILVNGSGTSISINSSGNSPISLVFPWDPKKINVLYNKVFNLGSIVTSSSTVRFVKSWSINKNYFFSGPLSGDDTTGKYFWIMYMTDRTSAIIPIDNQMTGTVFTALHFTDN